MKRNGSPELNDSILELYEDRRGRWRWRFVVFREKNGVRFWDIMANCGNDSYYTMELAEHYARWIICTGWSVKVDAQVHKKSWIERLRNLLFG